MYKNRLKEIKEIHEKATHAYARFENSSACADQDAITDSLITLFYEEHTDWLIEQAEMIERYQNAINLAIAQLEESDSVPFALDSLKEALNI